MLCLLAYGVYILLGDCFTSMCLALVCSLYLRDLKSLIESVLFKNINDPNRSLLRKIYIVRFFIRLYKTYTTKGFISVLYESFNYIINLIFLKIDSKSSTLFNDVPKIMAI
jgi:hypothetical protein